MRTLGSRGHTILATGAVCLTDLALSTSSSALAFAAVVPNWVGRTQGTAVSARTMKVAVIPTLTLTLTLALAPTLTPSLIPTLTLTLTLTLTMQVGAALGLGQGALAGDRQNLHSLIKAIGPTR